MMLDKGKKSNKLSPTSPSTRKLSTAASIITALGIALLPTFKTSWVVGSYFKFFSAKQLLLPIFGLSGTILVSIIAIVKKFFMTGTFVTMPFFTAESVLFSIPALYLSTLYFPTLAGSLYWSSYSWNFYLAALIRLGIPATCMLLFGLHPLIGASAFSYALLWLIPIAIYCASLIPQTAFSRAAFHSVFLQALGCTYTVHALGSVIWLYTKPMPSALWINLIPIAFVERLCFALAMTCAYSVVTSIADSIANNINTYNTQLKKSLLTLLPIKKHD